MIEKFKKMSAILVFILGVLVLSTSALAGTLQTGDLKVAVDGTDATSNSIIYVERGQEVEVEVWFTPCFDYNDVRVKAWLGGYEYEDVSDISSIFNAEEGVSYKKTLTLTIPDDLEIKDEESERDTYELRVEVYNDDDSIENKYILRLKEQRHKLVIQDIMLRPDSTVQAGNSLFATVRVANMGDTKEEDIRVTVSIPDLGISQRTYIDELTAHEEDNEDEESSMSSEEIFLRIPADAKTGFYPIKIDVEYSKGHEVVSALGKIYVQGTAAPEEEGKEGEVKAVIGTDATTKVVKQGEEVAYKLMIANMGSTSQIFSVEVSGEKLWGSSRVDPTFAKIQNDATGEMYIYIKANADAEAGKHMFTVKVKAGDNVVEEKTLTADVAGKQTAAPQVGSLKNALIIGFGVLVVLLIIIGLIVLFNRMSREEEPGEIPSAEGQAYY